MLDVAEETILRRALLYAQQNPSRRTNWELTKDSSRYATVIRLRDAGLLNCVERTQTIYVESVTDKGRVLLQMLG